MIETKTLSGLRARIYAGDGMAPHILHGAVLTPDGWIMTTWTHEGRQHAGLKGDKAGCDLVDFSEDVTEWIRQDRYGVPR